MDGIPPALDTDVEDVVWALQTADALWKRNERGDALVWLRRAAQAAGEANDDDRALVLARGAAELTESMTQPPSTDAVPKANLGSLTPATARAVPTKAPIEPPPPSPIVPEVEAPPAKSEPTTAEPVGGSGTPISAMPSQTADSAARVMTAAESHAGMLDPWADGEAPKPSERPPSRRRSDNKDVKELVFEEDEVITSVKPQQERPRPPAPPAARPGAPPAPAKATAPPAPAKPTAPPGAPKLTTPSAAAKPPKPPPPRPNPSSASTPAAPSPPPVAPRGPSVPASGVVGAADTSAVAASPAVTTSEVRALDAAAAAVIAEVLPPALGPLDLSGVEAFADLPDDVRGRFAAAATVRSLAKGDTVEGFGLVMLSEGELDVRASGADASSTSLSEGAVLRARGTLDVAFPVCVVCASPRATLATWTDADVEQMAGPCPWVEDDLRAAADRILALAGLALGPLGRSAYDPVRPVLAQRLVLRTLGPGESLLRETDPVQGLFAVAGGAIELSTADIPATVLQAGAFVFPAQTLSMGRAPASAKAGESGALVLHADRSTTQELLVTQPLLLELLSTA